MIKEMNCISNGENIFGLLYLPDELNVNLPIVILSHGLSLDHTLMIPYAEKFLSYGIASYIFDFRGGGFNSKSDGKISDMSILTEMDDLNNVLDMILNLDFIDKDKVYLAGHSQGALVSSLVAPNRCDDISGLFLFAPAYVIADDVKDLDNMREKNVMNLMPQDMGKTYIEGALSINLYEDIIDYPGLVYIYHGRKDARVPLRYAIEANDAYENSVLKIFDDEEHRFTDETKSIIVSEISEIISR